MGNIKGLGDITAKKVGIIFRFQTENGIGVVKVGRQRKNVEPVKRKQGQRGKSKTFTVTAPGEKERTGRYTLSAAAQKQREVAAQQTAYPVAKTPEELAENASRIEHIMKVAEIASHADRKDLLSLKSCFIEYLKLCQQDGQSVGNLGAYSAMGFGSAGDFSAWARSDDPERRAFVQFIKSCCAQFREGLISDGRLHPVVGIFWQRNFDGLRNDTEQVQSLQAQEDVASESNSYRKRYANLIGMESDDK